MSLLLLFWHSLPKVFMTGCQNEYVAASQQFALTDDYRDAATSTLVLHLWVPNCPSSPSVQPWVPEPLFSQAEKCRAGLSSPLPCQALASLTSGCGPAPPLVEVLNPPGFHKLRCCRAGELGVPPPSSPYFSKALLCWIARGAPKQPAFRLRHVSLPLWR